MRPPSSPPPRSRAGFQKLANFELLTDLIGSVSLSVEGLTFPVRTMYMCIFFFFLCIGLLCAYWPVKVIRRPSAVERLQPFADSLTGAFTYLVVFFYPILSSNLLRLWVAKEVGSGGKLLREDPQLRYVDVEPFREIGAGFLALYVVGIPAFILVVLWRVARPSALRATDAATRERNTARFGVLFDSYEEGCWWWELIEVTRKLLLTSVVIFISPGDV